jgi:hypothetical protein
MFSGVYALIQMMSSQHLGNGHAKERHKHPLLQRSFNLEIEI